MKKLLLSTIMLNLCLSGFAQNKQMVKSIKDVKAARNDIAVPFLQPGIEGEQQAPLKLQNHVVTNHLGKVTLTQTIIGNTTYDLQSNSSSIAARVYNSGSNIGAAWTYSTDLAGTYPDRGTAVVRSADNGSTWDPAPTARVESKRTGFGSLDRIGNGEVIISHNAGSPETLWSHANVTDPWDSSTIPFPVAGGYPLWPSMKVGGNNGTTIHMITATAPTAQTPPGSLFNGMDGAMVYSRSLDGGSTWDIQNIQFPEADTSASSPYLAFSANNYALDAKGDIVAVVQGSVTTDWSLWKSIDNGTTWTRTAIMPFPKPKFDQTTMDTDIDGDGIGDTVLTSDGAVSVVIDNNGVAHCFTGAMLVLEEPAAGALGLFLTTNGLLYWNENMGTNPPVVIAQDADHNDADGMFTFAANFTTCRYGNAGLVSQPSAAVDGSNNVYVTYSVLMENTDDGNLGCSYRNIWAQASPDGGMTWNASINLSASDFDEAVYPCVARDADFPGCLHLIWQQDGSPGTSVPPNGVGAIGNNDIIYSCVDPVADLGLTVGIKENSTSAIGISISPNPAGDFALIKFTLEKPVTVEVEIVNITGQRVAQLRQDVNTGNQSIRVNTSKFSKGVYSVNSKIDGKVFTNKLVIK